MILVTKDVNLRMKAKAISIPAEDYSTDRVHSIEALYGGRDILENVEGSLIGNLYQSPFEVAAERFRSTCGCELLPNKYYILKNSSQSALAAIDQECSVLRKVEKLAAYGVKPRNAEQTFAIDALTRTDIPLVTLTGKAGTGKTLLALASAIHVKRHYRQIFLARPIVPLSNKDMGYLPGDIDSKLAPYMRPLWDNLKVIQSQFPEEDKQYQQIDQMIQDGKLVISRHRVRP